MQGKGKTKGIASSLAKMTVAPILFLGIIITIFGIFWVKSSMEAEIESELAAQTRLAITTFDQMYPGDYSATSQKNEFLATKGDTILNFNYTLMDSLKEASGLDYTLFIGNIRVITTLTMDEERIIGSEANPVITQDVLTQKAEHFYKNVDVFGKKYFAYYTPIFNLDDSCVGMFAVLMPEYGVNTLILKAVLPLVLIIIIAAILSTFWARHYAKDFEKAIQSLSKSLKKVSSGTLSNTVSPELLARKDEFSGMGHSVIDMQSALRKLVDEDMLTGLTNRRSGQIRLEQLVEQTKGNPNGFCLALGDIDFFKKFNDKYGHDCGDLVLQNIARVLQSQIKDYGVCVRWGGEEFLIIFSRGNLAEVTELMEQTIVAIRDHEVFYNNLTLSVTMTFGLISTKDYETADDMVKAVDNLLYYGKENGRNRLVTQDMV